MGAEQTFPQARTSPFILPVISKPLVLCTSFPDDSHLHLTSASLSKFFCSDGLCHTPKPTYYNCWICKCLFSPTRWETSGREQPCFVLCCSIIGLGITMPYLGDRTPFSLSLRFMRLNQGLPLLGSGWGSTNWRTKLPSSQCIAQNSQIEFKLSCHELIL